MTTAKVMGILNVTSDSFYDGGHFSEKERAIRHALELSAQGADLIDVGGESTRPGAIPISVDLELMRVIPVIQEVKRQVKIPLSIDTTKPEVAAAALDAGVSLINDVDGFSHPKMRELAALSGVDICVMHRQGDSLTMQNNPVYPEGVVSHLLTWFENRIHELVCCGIKESQIIVDPGIGFGKTVAHNLQIIENLHLFKSMGFRVLLGASRKSFLSKIVNKPSADVLSETIAVNVMALKQGVDIIRVHDVKEHRGVVDLMGKFSSP